MLKYEVNIKDVETKRREIELDNFIIEEDMDNPDLLEMTCYYTEDLPITENTLIEYYTEFTSEFVLDISENDFQAMQRYYTPQYVNRQLRYFTIIMDRYMPLKILNIEIVEVNGRPFISFKFDEYHYFKASDDITIYFIYEVNGQKYEIAFDGCQYVDEYTLEWEYRKTLPGIDEFMCSVFHNDEYKFVGYEGNEESVEMDELPLNPCFTDELYVKIPVRVGCEDRYEYYEKECNEGNVTGLTSYRDTIIGDFILYFQSGEVKLPLPLSQMFEVRTEQEETIKDHFVYDEVRRSINGAVEMEKYVYHPVLMSNEGPQDVNKLIFNLHFRQRDTKTWSVDDNGYWNGVNADGSFMGGTADMDSDRLFFSYSDKSSQSDLISYLHFSDNDVKYQKSKLKKSFLRLSYYDSPNPAVQNLLHYSTIFIDTNGLFTKYALNFQTDPEQDQHSYVISGEEASGGLQGSRVNREVIPLNTDTDDDIEKYRLSSQITVSDTYNSSASSEGFNLYLWADNDNGAVASDVYLKIEFNHAGLGRTIPFMVPYYDPERDGGRFGRKTFEEIMNDWMNGSGYGFKTFERYSYIHLKYKYDKEKRRRIYYLDPVQYGFNTDSDTKNLVLNLYELKIINPNQTSEE